jgi:hypothetical protein
MRWAPIFPTEHSKSPTMERLSLVDNRLFGLYLHRFRGSKHRPIIGSHDHPWDFLSIVLRGGYEERPCACRSEARERWSFTIHRAEAVHSIRVNKEGCLTLCVRGPTRREWGWRR